MENRCDNSPTYSPELPTYSSHSPTYSPLSPMYLFESPICSPVSPIYLPETPTYSPTYSSKSPTYSPESPTYSPEYPNYSPQSPTYSPESPNYSPELPTYSPDSPNYLPNYSLESPNYSPESANYLPESPKYSSKCPYYLPEWPTYLRESPTYSLGLSTYLPDSPKPFEQKVQSSKRKIRAIEESDGDSSIYIPNKSRSRNAKSPSQPKSNYDRSYNSPRTSTGKPLTDDEAEYGYEPKGENAPILALESHHPISNPWIAECDHGAALYQPQFIGKPDVNNRREQYAQPLIRAAWVGDFEVGCSAEDLIYGLSGCVSSKACPESRLAVKQLPMSVELEKLPKWRVWPKSFERRGPSDDDIAVFFFPLLERNESEYEKLVFELIRDDLALRTKVNGSELLVFTSVDLPPLFTRFQGKLYLWGVFMGNQLFNGRLD